MRVKKVSRWGGRLCGPGSWRLREATVVLTQCTQSPSPFQLALLPALHIGWGSGHGASEAVWGDAASSCLGARVASPRAWCSTEGRPAFPVLPCPGACEPAALVLLAHMAQSGVNLGLFPYSGADIVYKCVECLSEWVSECLSAWVNGWMGECLPA